MSDSDVFIISAVQDTDPSQAIGQAIQNAGINPVRLQEVVFGMNETRSMDAKKIISALGLNCSTAIVSASLRAVFFAAQSVLSGDVNVVIVVGVENNMSTALLLASPDAVGRWNLLPRARLASRSLTKDIGSNEASIIKDGQHGVALVMETLNELERTSAQWGMVTSNGLALLMERI